MLASIAEAAGPDGIRTNVAVQSGRAVRLNMAWEV
jgi:hypothetical protein